MLRSFLWLSLRYGLIAGALAISFVVAMYYLGRHPLLVSPFLDFRIALYAILLFFALREYREYHQQGTLLFIQGMAISTFTVLSAAILAALGLWLFARAEPAFVGDYIQQATDYLKSFPEEDIERIGKEVYQRNLDMLPSTNAQQLASLYLAQSLVIGLFVGIIISAILRKQPKF
jgi:hypothetical protein